MRYPKFIAIAPKRVARAVLKTAFAVLACQTSYADTNSVWESSDVADVVQAMAVLNDFVERDFPSAIDRLEVRLMALENGLGSFYTFSQTLNSMFSDLINEQRSQLDILRSLLVDNNDNQLVIIELLRGMDQKFDNLASAGASNGMTMSGSGSLGEKLNQILDALSSLTVNVDFPAVLDVRVVNSGSTGDIALYQLLYPTATYLNDFQYSSSVSYEKWITNLDKTSPYNVDQVFSDTYQIEATKGDFITPVYKYFEHLITLQQQHFVALQRLCSYLSKTNEQSESEIETDVSSVTSKTLDQSAEDFIKSDTALSYWSQIKSSASEMPIVGEGSIPATINFTVSLGKYPTQAINVDTEPVREIFVAAHYFFLALYWIAVVGLFFVSWRFLIWIWDKVISIVGKFTVGPTASVSGSGTGSGIAL